MLRAIALVVLCAGCDVVFGLELPGPPTFDEDGDRIANDDDLCPHLPDSSDIDADGDGIGADCDVDDAVHSTRQLFAFRDGDLTGLRPGAGSLTPEPGALVLGNLADMSYVVFDAATGTVLVDVGFEILDNGVEAGTGAPWSEIGIYTAHRSMADEERGSVCVFGRDPDDPLEPAPGFLEFKEDESTLGSPRPRFPAPFSGETGRMRQVRTPSRMDCTVFRDRGTLLTGGYEPERSSEVGAIAISADAVRARLHYVWIVYPTRP